MKEWAKLWTDMLSDPKLLRATRDGHRGFALLPWLVLFARRADDHGRLSVGGLAAVPEDIAEAIPDDDADAPAVAATLHSCEAIGVLVRDADGVLRFTQWEDRQAKPSDSREAWRDRKRRQRDLRKSSTNSTGHAPVTPQVTRDNSGHVTPCPAIDKRHPTGVWGGAGVSPVRPAAADAAQRARDIVPVVPDPDLAEPTADERARAKALAAELRAVETP